MCVMGYEIWIKNLNWLSWEEANGIQFAFIRLRIWLYKYKYFRIYKIWLTIIDDKKLSHEWMRTKMDVIHFVNIYLTEFVNY